MLTRAAFRAASLVMSAEKSRQSYDVREEERWPALVDEESQSSTETTAAATVCTTATTAFEAVLHTTGTSGL